MTAAHISRVLGWIFVLVFIRSGVSRQNQWLSLVESGRRHSFSREAVCRSLCAANLSSLPIEQGRYFERCIRECTQEENPDVIKEQDKLDRSLRSRKSTRSRFTRAAGDGCPNSSVSVDFGPVLVPNVKVDFIRLKPNLSVAWEPIKGAYPDWTSYAVRYCDGSLEYPCRCHIVPKHQLKSVIIHGEGWLYPRSIYLAVLTFPYNKEKTNFKFDNFGPPLPSPPTFPPTIDTAKQIGAISGGLVAGSLLLLLSLFIFRHRIFGLNCFHDFRGNGERHNVVPPRINNQDADQKQGDVPPAVGNVPESYYACYYPENESFRLRVGRIVNHYRSNGYEVVMDIMDSGELVNMGPTRWAQHQIKRARKVLVFLSPGLLHMFGGDGDDMKNLPQESNRVWHELCLLQQIHTQTHSAAKMVCITFPDLPVQQRELPLWAELRYNWPEDAENILKRLNDKPLFMPL